MSTVRHLAASCALAAGVWGAAAGAQGPAGWTLIVRIRPNPVPFGSCAGVSVEPQDPDGYRTTSMSNGQPLDFHAFRYDADTTNFQWRGGNPVDGYLCPRMPGTPSQVTVTVTLPDGLSGSAVLTSVAPGAQVTPVQYSPQAPLRGHGAPLRTLGAGAPLGKTAVEAPGSYAPQSLEASALQMTGVGLSFEPLHLDGAPLGMTGTGMAFAAASLTADPLGMVGAGFAAAPMSLEAAPLGMVGAGLAFPAQAIAAARLSMRGLAP